MTRKEELYILIPAALVVLKHRANQAEYVEELKNVAEIALDLIELKNEQQLLISGKGKTE